MVIGLAFYTIKKFVMDNNIIDVFFTLVKSGLWEKETRLGEYEGVAFDAILELAVEQSVVGLVAVGLDKVSDIKVPQEVKLQIVGQTLQLEQRNKHMNEFIEGLIEKMRAADIYTLIVRGQSIAQCYERPLWRTCGDIDLFLSDNNYDKAKQFLPPLASSVEKEFGKHLGMTIDSWVVELHGKLHSGLTLRIDRVIDEIRYDIFYNGTVRSWWNGKTQVFLPAANDDIILVFTHFLKHFYKGGIGLRQICDWCRLLWTYKESLNYGLLESRIRKMGLMSEWRAFGAFAVDYLGMPSETMPMYSPDAKWKRKADKICAFIMDVGNFGHNRDMSYFQKYPYLIRKVISFGRRCGDVINHVRIFPIDSLRFFPRIMFNGVRSAIKGV